MSNLLQRWTSDLGRRMYEMTLRAATALNNFKNSLGRSFTHLFTEPPRRVQSEWLKMATSSPWIAAAERPIAYGVACAVAEAKLWVSEKRERELPKDHDFFRFLNSNPYLDIFQIAMLTDIWLTMTGDAFWLIERDTPNGPPKQLWPCPPQWVVQTPTLGTPFFVIQLQGKGFSGQLLPPIPQGDVIWFKNCDPYDPYARGKGAAEAAADEAEADEYAAKHEKTFYFHNAVPSVVIEHPDVIEKKGLKEKLEQWWSEKFGGFWNSFKPAFISGGMKIHQLSQNAKDSEHIESRNFRRAAIGGVIGTPKLLMGDTGDVNRSTAETSIYLFNVWTQIPHIVMMERTLQQRLVPQFKPLGAVLELPKPNTSDKEFDHKKNLENLRAGLLRVDEARKLEGYEDIAGTDYFLVPRGFVAVKDLSQVPLQSAAPAVSALPPAKAEQKAIVTKMSAAEWVLQILGDLDEWKKEAALRGEPFISEAVLSGGTGAMLEVGAGIAFDVTNPEVVAFLAARINRIKTSDESFEATTWQKLKATLIEGYQEGEGVTDLMKRVTAEFDDARGWRAENIARTEMGGALNGGAYYGYVQAEVELKSWLSAMDGPPRWRESHGEAHIRYHEHPIPMDQVFTTSTGGSGLFPGAMGSANEDCSCRCTLLPVIGESKGIILGSPEHWQRWDTFCKALDPHEKGYKADLIKMWNAREKEIMGRLQA